ncbi:MAG: polysaccharide deacetylase family protein [Clostridia bacterium]|nr:polysaccharide deacetylase family protein [Clostridia bacterium]
MLYHSVNDNKYSQYDYLYVSPKNFESQIKLLSENGYSFLFANEWRFTDTPSVIITFDDGYEDNYTEVFPILKKYEARVTVFLITDMIGKENYLSSEQIIEMHRSGLVSFQSHTVYHNDLSSISESDIRYEFEESANSIEALLGYRPSVVSYPTGKYNNKVSRISGEYYTHGYTTDSPEYVYDYNSSLIPRLYITNDYDISDFARLIR